MKSSAKEPEQFDDDVNINYDEIPELDLRDAVWQPNPIFEKITKPVRVRNAVFERVSAISKAAGIPINVLVSNILTDALNDGWESKLSHS